MNAIHPVFQQALAPFIHKPFTVKLQSFDYTLGSIDLACEVEYEAAEPRTWDEWDDPGEPASAILHSAKVGGVNIYELLDDDQRDEIEVAFLAQTEEY